MYTLYSTHHNLYGTRLYVTIALDTNNTSNKIASFRFELFEYTYLDYLNEPNKQHSVLECN